METLKTFFIHAVAVFPAEVATFLLAMTPVLEVRGSIPIAVFTYHMAPLQALLYSLAGNTLAGALVLLVAVPAINRIITHSQRVRALWQRYVYRIEHKNAAAFQKWGAVMLVLFVAIPLPMTGVFTGAVAASIFQVPFARALPLLFLGSLIASVIVTFLTVAVHTGIT